MTEGKYWPTEDEKIPRLMRVLSSTHQYGNPVNHTMPESQADVTARLSEEYPVYKFCKAAQAVVEMVMFGGSNEI